MRVLLSAVVLFFIVWSSAAAGQQQYTEATCLLLQQQIERFAGQPQNHYYLQARRDFNQHCQNPIAAPAKQLVLSNVPTKKVEPTTAASLASEPEVLTARPENTAAALVKFDMGAMLFSLFQPSIPYIVIFLLALILLPFFFLWFFGNQRQFLGAMAERQLHRVLLHRLPAGYQHYRNLILQTSQGDLTEIDHLVLSRFGIFVVEVKNYRGWIFGSEQQQYWTVQYFRRKHSFQNPLRQNYKHTEAVKFALGLTSQQNKHVYSVVAFSERAELKTTLPANVGFIKQVPDYIQQFNQPCFSDEQLRQFVAKLNLTSSSQAALRKDHKRQVGWMGSGLAFCQAKRPDPMLVLLWVCG